MCQKLSFRTDINASIFFDMKNRLTRKIDFRFAAGDIALLTSHLEDSTKREQMSTLHYNSTDSLARIKKPR